MSNDSASQKLLTMAGLLRPSAIRAAATLRLADHIRDGKTCTDDLAAITGTRPDVLEILLRYLAENGILTAGDGGYGLTELGDALRSDAVPDLCAYLSMDGLFGRADVALTGLVETVRTGEPSHVGVYGTNYWLAMNEDERFAGSFDPVAANADIPLVMGRDLVVYRYPWQGVRSVLDVGGHTGAVLVALLRAHPHLRGCVLDLANSVGAARQSFRNNGLDGRAEACTRSFFDPLPSGYDVYLVSAVLADWSDEDAVRILRRCADAAGSDGKILLAEVSLMSQVVETELLIRATMPAPGRSSDELKALGKAAGLAVTWEGPSDAMRSLIEFAAER